MTQSPDTHADHLCRMRKVNGDPCQSPALKGEDFCHYHKVMGPNPIIPENLTMPYSHIYLPRLDSAASIHAAISEVCELMLHRRIEPREASALFYAMQIASQNLGPLNSQSSSPASIQACAEQPLRRRPGRPRKLRPSDEPVASVKPSQTRQSQMKESQT